MFYHETNAPSDYAHESHKKTLYDFAEFSFPFLHDLMPL